MRSTDPMDVTAPLLAAGAAGYASKRDRVATLVDVLRTVRTGGQARSPEAEACWRWYAEHGPYGMPPPQLRSWRRDHGLPIDEDG